MLALLHTTVNAATSTPTTTTWTRPESCRPAVTRDDAAASTSTTASHRRLLSSNTNTNTTEITTTTSSSSSSHTSGTHAHASAQEVGFLTLCMFLGVVTRTFVEPKLLFHFIPYTVILILTGLLIGVLSIFTQYDDGKSSYNFRCHLAAVQPHGGRAQEVSRDRCGGAPRSPRRAIRWTWRSDTSRASRLASQGMALHVAWSQGLATRTV